MNFLKKYTSHYNFSIDRANSINPNVNLCLNEDNYHIHYTEDNFDAIVEYIESTGTQHIITDLYANQYPFKLETKIYFGSVTGEKDIWGNINRTQGDKYGFVSGQQSGSVFQWGGSLWKPTTCSINTWYSIIYEYVTNSSKKCIVNNTTYNNSSSNNNIINSNSPIYLFCDGPRASYHFIGRISYAKIYINNQLVGNFIPVRKGNKGYLYDRVTNKLYGNSGTGEFIVGPDVYDYQVEYLQSTGTQRINTEFVPDNTCGIYVRANRTVTASNSIPVGCAGTNARWWINFSTGLEISWNTYESVMSYSNDTWYEITNNFLNSRVGTIDGIVKRTSYPTLSSNNTYKAYIFTGNLAGNATNYFTGKISNVKFSKNNLIVMDFLPVIKNGVGYMYDIETNSLFGNSGTGNFTFGNIINKPYDREIEYLGADGNSYILTDFVVNNWYDFEIQISYPSITTTAQGINMGSIFGARSAWNSNVYQLSTYNKNTSAVGHFAFNQQGWNNTNTPVANIVVNEVLTIKKVGTVFYSANNTQTNLPTTNFTTIDKLPLFALNQNNVIQEIATVLRIHSFKLYNDNKLVLDLIPVRRNGIGYMYDKVSKKLLGNRGTGTFVLGPDK